MSLGLDVEVMSRHGIAGSQQGLGAPRQCLRRTHDKAWELGDSALGAHTTRPERVHDKDMCAKRNYVSIEIFLSRQTWAVTKKKPRDLGRHVGDKDIGHQMLVLV